MKNINSLKDINCLVGKLITTPTPPLVDLNEFKCFVANAISKHHLSSIINSNITNFERYYDEILDTWKRRKNLESLSYKTFKKMPIIFSMPFQNRESLLMIDDFLESYLEIIKRKNDHRSARKLFKKLLRNFKTFKYKIKIIIDTIRPIIKNSDNFLCKKLSSIDDRYQIISMDIIQVICNQILSIPLSNETTNSIDLMFANLGISPELQEGELGEEVGKELLQSNREKMSDNDFSALDRTLEYFIKDNDNKVIRLSHLHDYIIESLLCCFIENDPNKEVKEKLSGFIDAFFGDPRGNPKWGTVRDDIKGILLRWKVGVTLSVFFKLLDDVAHENQTHARHWPRRKAFWKGLLDRGEIYEAWIVLGKRYLEIKEKYLADDINFAKFSSNKNIEENHCAIILRIRGYVVAEWSHNGATRVYNSRNSRAPRFYQETYNPEELRTLSRSDNGYIAHSQTTWEAKIAKKLGIYKKVSRRIQR